MLTELEIVNSALGRLGCERIASLEDNNKRAKLANDFLLNSRNEALELAAWDFALIRESLSSSGTPAFEYTHQFDKPDELIWIVEEYNEEVYKVEGEFILANTDTLQIKYVAEFDEDIKRSASFDKAWYLTLAANLAYSLTQNSNLKSELLAEAEFVAARAASNNSKGSTPDSYEFNAFLDPRL